MCHFGSGFDFFFCCCLLLGYNLCQTQRNVSIFLPLMQMYVVVGRCSIEQLLQKPEKSLCIEKCVPNKLEM